MRQIALDTETTGLSTKNGDRIIEIGCVEVIDRVITGKVFHTYLNPEREINPKVTNITGIEDQFLKDKPKFSDIVKDFLDFIDGSELIIHNAQFDLEFINNELQLLGHEIQDLALKFKVIDTLILARTMHPGQRNNLDALCKRYKINANRTLHGALIDANILARLILKMTAGQINLNVDLLFEQKFTKNFLVEHEVTNNPKENQLLLEGSEVSEQFCNNKKELKIIYADQNELKEHKKYLKELLNK